jgi:hypothetical protein
MSGDPLADHAASMDFDAIIESRKGSTPLVADVTVAAPSTSQEEAYQDPLTAWGASMDFDAIRAARSGSPVVDYDDPVRKRDVGVSREASLRRTHSVNASRPRGSTLRRVASVGGGRIMDPDERKRVVQQRLISLAAEHTKQLLKKRREEEKCARNARRAKQAENQRQKAPVDPTSPEMRRAAERTKLILRETQRQREKAKARRMGTSLPFKSKRSVQTDLDADRRQDRRKQEELIFKAAFKTEKAEEAVRLQKAKRHALLRRASERTKVLLQKRVEARRMSKRAERTARRAARDEKVDRVCRSRPHFR